MRIGVKQTVHENLPQHGVSTAASHDRRIAIRCLRSAHRGHPHTIEEVHRQYGRQGEMPVDRRQSHGGIAVELSGDPRHDAPFALQVLFTANRTGKFFDQFRETVQRGVGEVMFSERSQVCHDREVALDARSNARPSHLDGDRCSRVQGASMHLGDRRGGNRGTVERQEDLADRPTECLLDRTFGDPRAKGGHRVLQ